MRKTFILAALLFAAFTFANAQAKQLGYTFVSDRTFYGLEDLIGYDFRPASLEIPGESSEEFSPGEYSFGITRRYLYVNGPKVKGVYNINAINTTEFGYILTTINARDARLQGHLKIILNENKRVEALIFRRSPDDKEVIYFLPYITKDLVEKERAYYTDWGEIEFANPDSLWGKTFTPFYRLHKDLEIQERLTTSDHTSIFFEEVITYETVVRPIPEETPEGEDQEKEETKKKEPEEFTLNVSLDSINTDSLEVLKHKETRTYFLELKTTLFYDDGPPEAKIYRYEIKRVKEREDETAAMDENRYQWELISPDAESIQLYLTGYRTLVAAEIDEKRYTVRGY